MSPKPRNYMVIFFSAAAVDSRLRLHCLTFGCTNIALCSQLEMRAADPQQLAMTPHPADVIPGIDS
jgi:hypothetical protein